MSLSKFFSVHAVFVKFRMDGPATDQVFSICDILEKYQETYNVTTV